MYDGRALTLAGPADAWDNVYKSVGRAAWGADPLPAMAYAEAAALDLNAQSALDCGCGDGRNITSLMRAVPFVVGSDLSRIALGRAISRVRATGRTNAVLLRDDIESSDFVDDTFDLVVALEVLSHLTDASAALDELLRICRPGGIVITDVFDTTDATRGNRESLDYTDEAGVYFRYYDRQSVDGLCGKREVTRADVHHLTWTDPPHGRYRPYEHVHETWCMVLRKR